MSVTCISCGILASPGIVLTDTSSNMALYSALWHTPPVMSPRREWCELPRGNNIVLSPVTAVLGATAGMLVLARCAPGSVLVRPHDPAPFQPDADGVPWCCQDQRRVSLCDHAHHSIAVGIWRTAYSEHVGTCSECGSRVPSSKWRAHRYQHVLAAARARYASACLTVAT